MSVSEVLKYVRGNLAKCGPNDNLVDTVKRMVELGVNALAVTNSDDRLVGILADHDVMRALANCNGSLLDEQVSEQMSSKVITCALDARLTQALSLMGKHNICHLVVTKNGHPVAILSIRDVLAKIHENELLEIVTLWDIALDSRAAMTH